jgi:hypothetical protein
MALPIPPLPKRSDFSDAEAMISYIDRVRSEFKAAGERMRPEFQAWIVPAITDALGWRNGK